MSSVSSMLTGVHKSIISGFFGFCGVILATFGGVRTILSLSREFLCLLRFRDITGRYPIRERKYVYFKEFFKTFLKNSFIIF